MYRKRRGRIRRGRSSGRRPEDQIGKEQNSIRSSTVGFVLDLVSIVTEVV